MMLVDPVKVAQALGMQTNGGSGSLDLTMLKAIIERVQPGVEASMNVATLRRVSCVDTFDVTQTGAEVIFRLSNGYLDKGSVTVNGPSVGSLLVDARLGTVRMTASARGRYTVAYQSGFEVDTTSDVATGVPPDVEGFIFPATTLWLRATLLTPKMPGIQGISIEQLTIPLIREIGKRIFGAYHRPRAGVEWSILYEEA